MVEIGGRPIMWHIMKFYAHQGIRDFVVLGGYKVELIRDSFLHYRARHCDFSIDLPSGPVEWSDSLADDRPVAVLATGTDSMTGVHLHRERHLFNDATFFRTSGADRRHFTLRELLRPLRATGAWCTST